MNAQNAMRPTVANYYNEFEPFAAAWLKELISAKEIPYGHVDTRSIADVSPGDLVGYTQHHFFAGIGGWPYALALAGWPTDRPVWTGSCPCQSFSNAGKQKGREDERHLWPAWFNLIRERKPTAIFGEQVASAITYGWLDEAFFDLESEAYACAAAILPACSFATNHERSRIFFGAYARGAGPQERVQQLRVFAAPVETPARGELSRILAAEGIQRWESESRICAVAPGFPNRVGLLRGYGNAIVPQVAAEFIKAAS